MKGNRVNEGERCCWDDSAHVCTNCGRSLCEWHFALSPIDVGGKIFLVPVCMPVCEAPWWKERNARKEVTP